MTTVTTVPLPQASLIAHALPQIQYADAYKVTLPPDAPSNLDTLVQAVFATTPQWTRILMRLRNLLVQPFDLKTTPPTPTTTSSTFLQPGAVVGIFRVFERTENEIILGDNDRHLDFRVGVLRLVEQGQVSVIVSTIVVFHNWLGRLYFVPVRPFHRLIVPAIMHRAVTQMGVVS